MLAAFELVGKDMDVIEWVEFRLKPEASEADLLAFAPAVTLCYRRNLVFVRAD